MSRPSPAAREVLSALEAQSPNNPSPTIASVSLPRHYQTASYLLSQARTYQREGSVEHAYVLYRRFVVYTLQTLHKHPSYNLSRWAAERAEYRKLCAEAMDQLECIREEIIGKYEHIEEQKEDVHKEVEEEEQQQPDRPLYDSSSQSEQQQQPALIAPNTAVDAELEARMSALVMEEQQQREQEKKEDSTYTEQLPTTYRAAEPPDHSLLATAYTMELPPLPTPPTEPSAPPLEEPVGADGDIIVTPSSAPVGAEAEDAADAPLIDNPVMPIADRSKWSNLRLPVRPPMPARPTSVSPPVVAPLQPAASARPAMTAPPPSSTQPARTAGLPTMPTALPFVPDSFYCPSVVRDA